MCFDFNVPVSRGPLQYCVRHSFTYQDSHFCSRDIPGASRSELDADCRRFVALYTRHTFAIATRVQHGVPPTLYLFVRVERPRSATTPLWDIRLSSPRLSKTSLSLGNSFVFFFVRGIPTVSHRNFYCYADTGDDTPIRMSRFVCFDVLFTCDGLAWSLGESETLVNRVVE